MVKLKITDTELIQLVRLKKRAGAEALYDRYSQALLLAIYRRVAQKETAEDLLEQIYIKAWNSIHLYDARNGSLLSWMMGIARDLVLTKKV